jgi:23S rRNA pseudouridine1911/1915/1917 synthase
MTEQIIKDEEATLRLDAWLFQSDQSKSRSQWQKVIKAGQVKVNGRPVNASHRLKAGDRLEIALVTETPAVKRQAIKAMPEIEVVAQCADYLVINKPAGVIVHGTKYSHTVTLVDWLLKHYPKLKRIGEDSLRPGIVHRLDKAVSGLMVIALSQPMFESLKQQFQTRTIEKRYLGLVYGVVPKDQGQLDFLLERSSSGHKMAAKPVSQAEGKEALTYFQVVRRFINYTLLELTIKTGRTHQIRAHLSAFNHQLLGDDLYGTAMTRIKNKKFKLGRVWLHSQYLAFDNLAGERVEFNSEAPQELMKVLEEIK